VGRREYKFINADIYPDAVQQVHPGEYFVPPCEKPAPVSIWETCQAVLYRERPEPRKLRISRELRLR